MTSQNTPRTCPCKTITWSLSSFTAAEFGDVNALSKALSKNSSNNRLLNSDSGITPLHLAAQHGHVAATWMLLEQGHPVDGGTKSKCTPLHRASFSGATATMRLLLETKRVDWLSRDTSFGDERTPLHKAAAGGRYLAVVLLVDALREEGLLEDGLKALDRNQETPLQVAQRIQNDNPIQERQSVARWDIVAGGSTADWDKVVEVLSNAEREIKTGDSTKSSLKSTSTNLPRHKFDSLNCLDCEANGECVTASWTAAFQKALQQSVTFSEETKSKKEGEQTSPEMPSLVLEEPGQASLQQSTMNNTNAANDDGGRCCESCGQKKFALFPIPGGLLVCKQCKRKCRKVAVH